MVDALIGAIIAVVATGALALLSEVATNAVDQGKQSLTSYEQLVVEAVKREHPSAGGVLEKDIVDWMERVGALDQ